jgi:hypothetical protein
MGIFCCRFYRIVEDQIAFRAIFVGLTAQPGLESSGQDFTAKVGGPIHPDLF